MQTALTRIVPDSALDNGFKRLGDSDHEVRVAMQEFADWCIRHQNLLEQGRKHDFRLGTTPMVKDIIALAANTPGEAARVTANILDLPQ